MFKDLKEVPAVSGNTHTPATEGLCFAPPWPPPPRKF